MKPGAVVGLRLPYAPAGRHRLKSFPPTPPALPGNNATRKLISRDCALAVFVAGAKTTVWVSTKAITRLRVALLRKTGTTRGILGEVSEAVLAKAKEIESGAGKGAEK